MPLCPQKCGKQLLKSCLVATEDVLSCTMCEEYFTGRIKRFASCAGCDYDICETCFWTLQPQRPQRAAADQPAGSLPPRRRVGFQTDEEPSSQTPQQRGGRAAAAAGVGAAAQAAAQGRRGRASGRGRGVGGRGRGVGGRGAADRSPGRGTKRQRCDDNVPRARHRATRKERVRTMILSNYL